MMEEESVPFRAEASGGDGGPYGWTWTLDGERVGEGARYLFKAPPGSASEKVRHLRLAVRSGAERVEKSWSVLVKRRLEPPVILSFRPLSPRAVVTEGGRISFSVEAEASPGETPEVLWLLDGPEAHSGGQWTYLPREEDVGTHRVVAEVRSEGGRVLKRWSVEVLPRLKPKIGWSPKRPRRGETIVVEDITEVSAGRRIVSREWLVDGEEKEGLKNLSRIELDSASFEPGELRIVLRMRDDTEGKAVGEALILLREDVSKAARALLKKGNESLRAGRWSEASELFRQALREEPENGEARINLSRALQKEGRWREALGVLGDQEAAFTERPDVQGIMGRSYEALGKEEEALESYRRAARADETKTEIPLRLGKLLWERKEFDEAEEAFISAMKRNPSHALPHAWLGVIYVERGWLDQAVSKVRNALKMEPENAEVNLCVGRVYERKGWKRQAEKAYLKAVEKAPSAPWAHEALGDFYRNARKKDKLALESYRRAQTLAPGSERIREKVLSLGGTGP